jgi:hypothetical protein
MPAASLYAGTTTESAGAVIGAQSIRRRRVGCPPP